MGAREQAGDGLRPAPAISGAPMPPGLYNMDCMEALPLFPDGFFDLAIVDPPYGGGYVEQADGDAPKLSGGGAQWQQRTSGRWGQRFARYHISPEADAARRTADPAGDCGGGHPTGSDGAAAGLAAGLMATISATRTGGTWAAKYNRQGGVFDDAEITHWDVAPPPEYFDELARVSRNQIIWGGNYFDLPPTRCFVVWDKKQPENFSMAMAEYAWTSLNENAKVFYCAPQGNAKERRFHPTQKPVALYTWLLRRYAKAGMRILDTHAGSASLSVACRRAGLDCWAFEIDPEYYRLARERLDRENAQVNLFDVLE